jgi:hypothetical protein
MRQHFKQFSWTNSLYGCNAVVGILPRGLTKDLFKVLNINIITV